MTNTTRALAEFLAELRYEDIPDAVLDRCEELFLDWLGSALAGKDYAPIPIFERFALLMGPHAGKSEILTLRTSTSPYFAAFVNAAASHVVEQDDLHNSSVLHPGTVVFPAVLAAAQAEGKSGRELIVAAVAGYEAGIRIGESLGRSHYTIFHTTGTVGTLAAAVGVGKLLGFSSDDFMHALGSAGTQAAGLWEFLRDGADSKQLHTAKAAADGLLAAYMTADGLTGAQRIIDGKQGMAAGMSLDADPECLADQLGSRWALKETSFKFHASCRHTHPAADALLAVMEREGLDYSNISAVVTPVHQAAIDVLGPVDEPSTVHQAKFSMGTVLGLIAVHGKAGLEEFQTHALKDEEVAVFRRLVTMRLDPEVNEAYPSKWIGKVEVTTQNGQVHQATVRDPKGDPENTLSRTELEHKFRRLVGFSGAVDESESKQLVAFSWGLRELDSLPMLLTHA
ncbi:MmgE/PrpD family protein [Halomonas sp. QX-2]|uniref:MmgE/PrpD family protein n=1 Tax=Vreelandella sedimenti TaxID=2729618 RepID=A0A7Z0NB71_9GAMM|nr:MmgE/PrpD family protein [Halomonas sedimenti]NYT74965.1 MmgE/PrpD family protein [Halomonas sedimenti]